MDIIKMKALHQYDLKSYLHTQSIVTFQMKRIKTYVLCFINVYRISFLCKRVKVA